MPFREVVAALVLNDVGIAALDRRDHRRHVAGHAVGHIPEVEVVWSADENGPHLARAFRPINVGGQPHAIAHRHHDLAIDDGDFVQLAFGRKPLRDLIGRKTAAPLSHQSRASGHCEGERKQQTTGWTHEGPPWGRFGHSTPAWEMSQ